MTGNTQNDAKFKQDSKKEWAFNKESPPQADGVLEECQLVICVELLGRIPLLLDIFAYECTRSRE